MKRLVKVITGICLAWVLCLASVPVTVQAASINVTAGTTDNGRVGNTVTVRLVLSNNPGISTFAAALQYDDSYLTYSGCTWSNAISSDNKNIEMVSDVEDNGRKTVNISAILDRTYSNNETICTLSFSVKKEYRTMPVLLTIREITDSSFNPVTTSTIIDANAGRTTQSQTNSQNSQNNNSQNSQNNNSQNSQNNNSQNSQNNNSQSSQNNNSQNSNNNSNNSSNNSNNSNTNSNNSNQNSSDNENNANASSDGNSTSASSGKNGEKRSGTKSADHTPKTGTMDVRIVLGVTIVVFLLIAGICLKVLGKKKES